MWKRWWFIAAAVLVLIGAGALVVASSGGDDTEQAADTTEENRELGCTWSGVGTAYVLVRSAQTACTPHGRWQTC